MAWYNFWKSGISEDRIEQIEEEIKAFKNKGDSAISDKHLEQVSGEGISRLEIFNTEGYGKQGYNLNLQHFNNFYRKHINTAYQNEIYRLQSYREMADMPEIADVIEDAVNESTQEDQDGNIIHLDVVDSELEGNENIVNNLQDEFEELFYKRLDIKKELWDMMRTYFIDGRVYYERIIHEGKKENGIRRWKKLPTETMDFIYDYKTGRIQYFLQYLSSNPKKYTAEEIEEARQDTGVIVFYPEQIGYVDYGIYGQSKNQVIGYLEKAKQPYNQLKLLETSVVIYRLIRSPERFVFKIDTGNMPMEKAMKFAEKIRDKFSKKQSFDSATGRLSNEPEIFSMLENYFLPQSADGRGSDISTIGGNPAGFAELDDIYYFARKLYRALKYPQSRVSAMRENRESDVVLRGGAGTGEIVRDEMKWARFLERQQNNFCDDLLDIFLLHLEFKGLKAEYELDKSKLNIFMNAPNQYKDQLIQADLENKWSNYSNFRGQEEFSIYFLQKEFLGWDDDKIQANIEGKAKDKELGYTSDEDIGF